MNRPTLSRKEEATLIDRIAYLIATGAGAGFLPVAPGTFGALEGVAIYLATGGLPATTRLMSLVIINVALFAVGVWAATRACRMCELEDPGQVVIDEVSGQLIALTPLAVAPSILGIVLAFGLFRLFDIFKPYPIRKLEHMRAGLGVMSDDALAGLYAAVLVWLCVRSGWL